MLGLGVKPRFVRMVRQARLAIPHLIRPRLMFRGRRENIAVVFSEPHDMPIGDRITLYGLIRGLKPKTYLEIGVRWGGSTRIVTTAMQANGFGDLVGLDPVLKNFRPRQSELFGRVTLVEGYSPDDTPKAAAALPGPVDLAFIDAVHTYSAVKLDLAGVLPFLSDTAHILFHDAYHQGIDQAVEELLDKDDTLTDCGLISRNPTVGTPVSYTGLRLVRKGKMDFNEELILQHAQAGVDAPNFTSEVWDYDPYANAVGNALGRG